MVLSRHVVERVLGSDNYLVQLAEEMIHKMLKESSIEIIDDRRYAFSDRGILVLDITKDVVITFIPQENVTQEKLLTHAASFKNKKSGTSKE